MRGGNGVSCRLDVALPRAPPPAGRSRPLVVVLDSDYGFPIVRAIVEHLAERGWADEVVVIGVGYAGSTTQDGYRTNRTLDHTPVPYPTGDYGITGPRILVGHSYGGLFACWLLVEHPGAFDGYVAVSPSLW